MSRAQRGAAAVALAAGLVLAGLPSTCPAPAAADEFPYEKDGNAEFWLLTSSAMMGGVGLVATSRQEPLDSLRRAQLDRQKLWGIDRGATDNWSPAAGVASDLLELGAIAAPVAYVAVEHSGEDSGTLYLMYGETLLAANVANLFLKSVTDRARPYAYNDDPEIPDAERLSRSAVRSFPSTHTANAFAAAVFMGTVYGETHPGSSGRTWVWAGGLTVAVTTGILRVVSGRHFPTDVLAGAAIGSLAGWAVPKLHERPAPVYQATFQYIPTAPSPPLLSWTIRF